MRWLSYPVLLILSSATLAETGVHRSSVSLSYGSGEGDFTSSGTKYDMDLDGFQVNGMFYLDAEIFGATPFIGINRSDVDAEIAGIDIDTKSTEGFVGLAFSGVDVIKGEGQEFQVAIDRDDDQNSNLNLAYAVGLGNGLTGSISYYTDVNSDLMDDMSGIGLGMSVGVTDNLALAAQYWAEEGDYKDGDKIDGDTWAFGITYYLDK